MSTKRIAALFVVFVLIIGVGDAMAAIVFDENFETGWGDWYTDQGVWQIGVPTSGPSSAHEGTSVAGTDLDGNYPDDTDSRLISPPITLPNVTGSEQLQLRFWQWYSYEWSDHGEVHISVWEGSSWGAWVTVATPAPSSSNSDWSLISVDLTTYAGQQIRAAFYHTASDSWTSSGWYIDEVTFASCPSCSGDAPVVRDVTFRTSTTCECIGNVSLTIGPGAVIERGAKVEFRAPRVSVKSGVHAEEGSIVTIKQ